jgi:hypothetical protein
LFPNSASLEFWLKYQLILLIPLEDLVNAEIF